MKNQPHVDLNLFHVIAFFLAIGGMCQGTFDVIMGDPLDRTAMLIVICIVLALVFWLTGNRSAS